MIFIIYTDLYSVTINKKAGTTSLLTSFLPICRGVEADRQETITIRLQLPDTPSDVSITYIRSARPAHIKKQTKREEAIRIMAFHKSNELFENFE